MSHEDLSLGTEGAVAIAVDPRTDMIGWHCHTKVEKWDVSPLSQKIAPDLLDHLAGEEQVKLLKLLGATPFEVTETEGNALHYGGMSNLWQCLIGNGTATAGQALTYFSTAQAGIGVGDSSAANVLTGTNLQGAASPTNRIRKTATATHTDGTTSGAATVQWAATFSTSEANFTWNEWGVFNSTTDATGRMLNRKVENLGTKTSAAAWTITVTITLS